MTYYQITEFHPTKGKVTREYTDLLITEHRPSSTSKYVKGGFEYADWYTENEICDLFPEIAKRYYFTRQ